MKQNTQLLTQTTPSDNHERLADWHSKQGPQKRLNEVESIGDWAFTFNPDQFTGDVPLKCRVLIIKNETYSEARELAESITGVDLPNQCRADMLPAGLVPTSLRNIERHGGVK